jgi:hypothetical protein
MKRYAAKILFQFRVVVGSKSNSQRTVEERIVLIRAATAKVALAKAKRIGKQREYNYNNDEGNAVHVECVGVMELIGLDPECLKDEVWYDIRTMLKPMERRKDILPKESQLSAIKIEA